MAEFPTLRARDLDLWSGHTAYRHASLIDLYLHTKFIEIEETLEIHKVVFNIDLQHFWWITVTNKYLLQLHCWMDSGKGFLLKTAWEALIAVNQYIGRR